MKGLYLDNLIGVIKDASSLSQSLRNHGSIRVFPDRSKEGKEFALVEFQKKPDGTFGSPATELAEKDMTYFLIQAVNTYKGSTLIVKNAENGKLREIRTDRRGIQKCNIRGSGIVIRVSQRGHIEIYYVTSPTENNKKKVKYHTLFEGDIPFNNSHIANIMIEDNEYLKAHAEDIKKAYEQIKENKFENRLDLSEVQLQQFKKDKAAETSRKEEAKTPPVNTEPEIDKGKGRDKDVKKPEDKVKKNANTSKKIQSEKIINNEAEEEIKNSVTEDEVPAEKPKDKTEERTEVELAKEPLTQKLNIPVAKTKETQTKKPKPTKAKTAKK